MNKTIKKELILLKDLGMKFPTEKSVKKYRYGLYQCFCGKEFESVMYDSRMDDIPLILETIDESIWAKEIETLYSFVEDS